MSAVKIKKLLCALGLLSMSFNSNCQDKTDLPVFEAVLRGRYFFNCQDDSPKHYPKREYYLLDAKLINNSDSVITFLTHYSTPITNVVLTSDEFKIIGNMFYNNAELHINLDPGKEFSFPLILEKKTSKDYGKIVLGWAYLTFDNTGNDIKNYMTVLRRAHKTYENVIWSDSLSMGIGATKFFQIR
jgi:hypothetical protein